MVEVDRASSAQTPGILDRDCAPVVAATNRAMVRRNAVTTTEMTDPRMWPGGCETRISGGEMSGDIVGWLAGEAAAEEEGAMSEPTCMICKNCGAAKGGRHSRACGSLDYEEREVHPVGTAAELARLKQALSMAEDDGDYCWVCDNHPSHGHSKDCPMRDYGTTLGKERE